MYVVGLALCTLGNIASVEMAMDLCPEIEKLLCSSNAYLRKKAALCAVRILRKVPHFIENFLPRCRTMLGERNHGAMLTGLTLTHAICQTSPTVLQEFRNMVPSLVKVLKQLITTGYSPEHDVSGITDPFLQVKLLRLLRVLGANDPLASEQMNDVLAQVATNTDGSKNVGNAILYETVLTILDIQAEQTLRVLAINILGKFLSNKDNNIRYVALQTLCKTIHMDAQAVQRHRGTILECLRDPDVSIRRRALDLAFALVNAQNVRVMTRELLSFLEIADVEFRPLMVNQLCSCAEKYAPNPRWHIDTLIRLMKLAGHVAKEDVMAQFVKRVSHAPDLHGYTVHRLFHMLSKDLSQEVLVHAGVWMIGEYGDVLVKDPPPSSDLSTHPGDDHDPDMPDPEPILATPNEPVVIDLLQKIVTSKACSSASRNYTLCALMKLSARFTSSGILASIQSILAPFKSNIDLESQQRALEYSSMFSLDPSLRASLFERIPALELKEENKYSRSAAAAAEPVPSFQKKQDDTQLLLDLDGLSLTSQSTQPVATGLSTFPSQTLSTTQKQSHQPSAFDLMADLFAPQSMSTSPTSDWKVYTAYQSKYLIMTFTPSKQAQQGGGIQVQAHLTNVSSYLLDAFSLLVAVPKSMQIQLSPLPNQLPPHQSVEHSMIIQNPEKKQLKLRLKLIFQCTDGTKVDEIVEFKFPESIV
ncbi:clathrin associated protein complex large subunit [Coelomomyces lativittatus]|nr:clathrin associated protein complex large subunit [Coelomomyces lativittatus]